MNINQKYIITINRELGSGGRTVGRKLAEKLGVEYFDKAVVNALQERYNLSVEQIEHMKGQEQSLVGGIQAQDDVLRLGV